LLRWIMSVRGVFAAGGLTGGGKGGGGGGPSFLVAVLWRGGGGGGKWETHPLRRGGHRKKTRIQVGLKKDAPRMGSTEQETQVLGCQPEGRPAAPSLV